MSQSAKDTETEVKIKVRDLSAVEDKLRQLDAALKAPRVYERNVRYDDNERSLTPEGRVLRLRQDTRVRLTYKESKKQHGEKSTTRTEYEVTVSDFDTMEHILDKLGFSPAWVYEKYRTTYDLDECEVVLDEMPFGPFIEVEGDAEAIERVLDKMGLGKERRVLDSYSVLFFNVKQYLHLDVKNLTFEEFKSIKVPDEAFIGGSKP